MTVLVFGNEDWLFGHNADIITLINLNKKQLLGFVLEKKKKMKQSQTCFELRGNAAERPFE